MPTLILVQTFLFVFWWCRWLGICDGTLYDGGCQADGYQCGGYQWLGTRDGGYETKGKRKQWFYREIEGKRLLDEEKEKAIWACNNFTLTKLKWCRFGLNERKKKVIETSSFITFGVWPGANSKIVLPYEAQIYYFNFFLILNATRSKLTNLPLSYQSSVWHDFCNIARPFTFFF